MKLEAENVDPQEKASLIQMYNDQYLKVKFDHTKPHSIQTNDTMMNEVITSDKTSSHISNEVLEKLNLKSSLEKIFLDQDGDLFAFNKLAPHVKNQINFELLESMKELPIYSDIMKG